jgi:hypothetical protein
MGSAWLGSIDKENRERLVSLAVRDLAEQEGIDPASGLITVKSVTPVTWQDMNLGYPRPGRKVAPGYVPGFQIILEYNSREYDYHSGFGRVVYVPPGKGQPPLPAEAI